MYTVYIYIYIYVRQKIRAFEQQTSSPLRRLYNTDADEPNPLLCGNDESKSFAAADRAACCPSSFSALVRVIWSCSGDWCALLLLLVLLLASCCLCLLCRCSPQDPWNRISSILVHIIQARRNIQTIHFQHRNAEQPVVCYLTYYSLRVYIDLFYIICTYALYMILKRYYADYI